jgi:hypothetical protein
VGVGVGVGVGAPVRQAAELQLLQLLVGLHVGGQLAARPVP